MQYTLLIFKQEETGRFVGVFPELDSVSSFGDDIKEVESRTIEAATLWLEDKEPPASMEMGQLMALASLAPESALASISGIEFG